MSVALNGSEVNSSHSSQWKLFGNNFPRREIVFFSQVLLIYIIVITCIINLTLKVDNDKAQLWTALLSACLGYLLPNPTLNLNHKNET